ncbi:MAG: hypothetical protein DHS20C13_01310 [Thermodesulfobacteriota bacterium]|nr:MAG: hypothetical protein DHS20C13_01310 [Thermodesulfobacteriota bacterium]
MKNYLKLLTLIGFALFIYACSNENNSTNNIEETKTTESNTEDSEAVAKYDFRRANWGMSIQEVKESEEMEPVLESENTLDYSIFLMGMQVQIGYTFKDDELIRAGFFFLTKPDTNNKYIETYTKLQEELKEVNGKPILETEQQIDPSQTIDPEKKAEAVCNGDLLYATQWDLPKTDIQLILRGEDSECKLTIIYLSEEGFRQILEDRSNK